MCKKNSKASRELGLQLTKLNQKLSYRQPEVFVLGSLKQVQSYYEGGSYDGPDRSYYYTPRR
jgi:hypothetical protein